MPITTSPPIMHEIVISESSRKIDNLCMPHIRLNYRNMRYDLFLEKIATKEVKGLCISNNQKEADLIMKDDSHNNVYFPESYDIVSYVLRNDIPIEFREVNEKPSIIDIISLMLQVALVRILSQVFSITNSTSRFEQFIVKLLSSDFHTSVQYLYNFAKSFTKEDVRDMMRNLNCNLYINRRQVRKIMKKINHPLP